MRTIEELSFPDVGQTVIIKEIFGKKRIRKTMCTVEKIYTTHILVEHQQSMIRESFMKADFLTGHVEFEKCI